MLIVRIHNDWTGDPEIASYNWDVAVTTSPKTLKILAKGRIEQHDRTQDWRALVRKVLGEQDRDVSSS